MLLVYVRAASPPDKNGEHGKRCVSHVANYTDYNAAQSAKFAAAENTSKPGNSNTEFDRDIQKFITVLKEPAGSMKGSYPLTGLRLAFPHDVNTSRRIDKKGRLKHISKQFWRDAGISEAFITCMMDPAPPPKPKVATGTSAISTYFGR